MFRVVSVNMSVFWKHAEGMSLRYGVIVFCNFLCSFPLWLGEIGLVLWGLLLLLLGFLGGEFLFVVFEVFA